MHSFNFTELLFQQKLIKKMGIFKSSWPPAEHRLVIGCHARMQPPDITSQKTLDAIEVHIRLRQQTLLVINLVFRKKSICTRKYFWTIYLFEVILLAFYTPVGLTPGMQFVDTDLWQTGHLYNFLSPSSFTLRRNILSCWRSALIQMPGFGRPMGGLHFLG